MILNTCARAILSPISCLFDTEVFNSDPHDSVSGFYLWNILDLILYCIYFSSDEVFVQHSSSCGDACGDSALVCEMLCNLTRWETAQACLIMIFRPFVHPWLNRHCGWGFWLGKRNFGPKPYSEMWSPERLTSSSRQQRQVAACQ